MKLILIVPYFGKWPVWFPAFLQSCKYNPLVDWIFFTDCDIPEITLDNVFFIPFTSVDFNSLASEKLGFEVKLSRPYKLCDFKPAYGVIFEQYVRNYDFWGCCDIDVVWGDIRKFITDEILNKYDIVTTRRKKIAGHFTLFRNEQKINFAFTRYPNYKDILQSPKSFNFAESKITVAIDDLMEKEDVKVYWEKFLLNSANSTKPNPSVLRAFTNRYYWENGKLYDKKTGEIMYLHFMTWKKSLKACYFDYLNRPISFYISYSHIGLSESDPPPSLPLVSLLVFYAGRLKDSLRQELKIKKAKFVKIAKDTVKNNN